jgi:hypothetical protein
MHYRTMWNYLIGRKRAKDRVQPPGVIPNITDAQCVDGNLIVARISHWGYGWGWWPFPAWTFGAFPQRNYHTYDYNLFFVNLRVNARERVLAWKP